MSLPGYFLFLNASSLGELRVRIMELMKLNWIVSKWIWMPSYGCESLGWVKISKSLCGRVKLFPDPYPQGWRFVHPVYCVMAGCSGNLSPGAIPGIGIGHLISHPGLQSRCNTSWYCTMHLPNHHAPGITPWLAVQVTGGNFLGRFIRNTVGDQKNWLGVQVAGGNFLGRFVRNTVGDQKKWLGV